MTIGHHHEITRMELHKAVSLFLAEYKPSTRKAYASPLALLAAWLGPGRPVDSITPTMLLEWWQNDISHRPYTPATKMKHLKSVKTFFNWCVRMQVANASPARVIRGFKLRPEINRDRAMSDAELAILLDYAKWRPQLHALLLFLADTGCRRGGAAGLKITDIDFDQMTAVVTEKGDLTRQVAFGELCKRALEHWIAHRALSKRHIKGIHVFSQNGAPVNPESISLMFRRACHAVGIRSLGPHSLRHRKGHQMADARIAPSVAATALGHSDPVITLQAYYPRDWERAREALRQLAQTNEPPPAKVIKFGS